MLRAYITGFVECLLVGSASRSRQPSFEMNLAYDRGATVAEVLTFWRSWSEGGPASTPSRFKWWLRTRNLQREALRNQM
jgi:hypothetical protein